RKPLSPNLCINSHENTNCCYHLLVFPRKLRLRILVTGRKQGDRKTRLRGNPNAGRFELAEQLYAKDFVNHGIHRNASLEEDQAALKGWHKAFPDVSIVPEKLIAEDDLVTIFWIAKGTNTGTGNGLPATGKKAELAGI